MRHLCVCPAENTLLFRRYEDDDTVTATGDLVPVLRCSLLLESSGGWTRYLEQQPATQLLHGLQEDTVGSMLR